MNCINGYFNTQPTNPEPMRGSATAAYSTNGSAGKTVSGQAHYSHRLPAQPASSFILIPAYARLRLRECCTFGHGLSILRRVRGRIQLAALVSGIVVPPQPDPDVTQARCSITDCPATPASRLALTMTSALLRLPLHSLRAPLFSLRSGVSVL